MHPPSSHTYRLRAGVVGTTSAILTVGSHAWAGGALPSGGALVIVLLLCATIGASVGRVRRVGWPATTLVLGFAQLAGHTLLAAVGTPHHSGDSNWTSMVAAHAAAAVLLGGVISVADYLYGVCSSVLCWLRLFAVRGPRPSRRPFFFHSEPVAPQAVPGGGLGMRAPPASLSTV